MCYISRAQFDKAVKQKICLADFFAKQTMGGAPVTNVNFMDLSGIGLQFLLSDI